MFLTSWSSRVLAGVLLLTASVDADITVTGVQVGSSFGMTITGETTTRVKGTQQRVDAVIRGAHLSTIVDLHGARIVLLDHEAQRAEVYVLPRQTSDTDLTSMTVTIEGTGARRVVAGVPCDEYRVAVSDQDSATGSTPRPALISGEAWVWPGAPGAEDWRRFYAAARELKAILGDPRATRADARRARGLTALESRLAEMGVGCGMRLGFRAGDARAAGAAVETHASVSTELTGATTAEIDDQVFVIPAGYRTEQK